MFLDTTFCIDLMREYHRKTRGPATRKLFACAMIAVHVWGHQIYRRQWIKSATVAPVVGPSIGSAASIDPPTPSDDEVRDCSASWTRISWPAILAQQAFALLLASILLDSGDILRLCLAAVVVYWLAVFMGWVLRRGQATTTDRVLLAVGYWPLAAVISVAQAVVWAIRGL